MSKNIGKIQGILELALYEVENLVKKHNLKGKILPEKVHREEANCKGHKPLEKTKQPAFSE